MIRDKARQWDGRSRPTNDTYKKNFNDIFNKKKVTKRLPKSDQEYLNTLKHKL
jgi:hypothetical protein|tara:strand:+ start:718 stop:876 length:159 start_codon:yes stop_codon:yes gene_type:complete